MQSDISTLALRTFRYPQDADALAKLDTSFTTERIYRPVYGALSFQLREEPVTPPLSKRYPLEVENPAERAVWDYAVIAEEAGETVGFVAAQYTEWNRRVILWHLYIAPSRRRKGVGARLLEAAEAYAHSVQARHLWLETQNTNYPAVQFYQRAGFAFCGFDSSLYDQSELEQEETALFFMRPTNSG